MSSGGADEARDAAAPRLSFEDEARARRGMVAALPHTPGKHEAAGTWTRMWDEDRGRHYWMNTETWEVRSSAPPRQPALSEASRRSIQRDGVISSLSGEWTPRVDPATGKLVWENRWGAVRTDSPYTGDAASRARAAAPHPAAVDGKWVRAFDDSRQRHYWWHTGTYETTWHPPHGETAHAAAPAGGGGGGGGGGAAGGAAGASRRGNWVRELDPGTGRVFWFNTATWDVTYTEPREAVVQSHGDRHFRGVHVAHTPTPATPASMSPDVVAVRRWARRAAKWSRVQDAATGKQYWYNSHTFTTTDIEPADVVVPEFVLAYITRAGDLSSDALYLPEGLPSSLRTAALEAARQAMRRHADGGDGLAAATAAKVAVLSQHAEAHGEH